MDVDVADPRPGLLVGADLEERLPALREGLRLSRPRAAPSEQSEQEDGYE